MAELEKNVTKKNVIKVVYGEGVEVTGIESVISVDATEVVLKLQGNTLVIKGEEFNVEKLVLEQSEIKVTGKVLSLSYDKAHEKVGILKRVFK